MSASALIAQDQIYLVGDPQGWGISDASMPLQQTASGVYEGTYDIPEGKFTFRFYKALGNWDANSIGSQSADNPISISFTNGKYEGSVVQGGKGSWSCGAWGGGPLKMTVNLNTNKVTFEGEVELPETIYLVGNFNGWNVIDSNYAMTGQDGIYTGEFNLTNWSDSSLQYKVVAGNPGSAWENLTLNLGSGTSFEIYSNMPNTSPLYANGDNIICTNWTNDGPLKVTVDLNNMTILSEGPDQPAYTVSFDKLYLVGNPNNWDNKASTMVLNETESGVFEGTFNIPNSGSIASDGVIFRLFNTLGGPIDDGWNPVYSFGPRANENDNVNISFSNVGVYESTYTLGKGCWVIPNWNGGDLKIIFDSNTGFVTMIDVANYVDIVSVPEALYLSGNMNGWENSDSAFALTPVTETPGLFTGSFEIDEITDGLELKLSFPYNSNYYNFGGNGDAFTLSDIVQVVELVYDGEPIEIENWQGGILVVEADWNTKELSLSVTERAPQQLSMDMEVVLLPNRAYYYTAEGEGTLMIQTQDTNESLGSQAFVYTDASHNTPVVGIVSGTNATGAYFNVPVTGGQTYYIYFTEPSTLTVEATFKRAAVEMAEATLLTPAISEAEPTPAVQLTWGNREIKLVNVEAISIPVEFNGESIGELDGTYVQIMSNNENEPSIDDDNLIPGETSGTILAILLGSSNLYKGSGIYTLALPANMVAELEYGDYNPAQTIQVECTALVVGEATPVSPATFHEGDDVLITILFEGETIEENPGEDAPVIVFGPDDFELTLNWGDEGLTINEDDLSVVIDLGEELSPGEYILYFKALQVIIDGEANDVIEYSFTVVAKDDDNNDDDNGDGDNNNGDGDDNNDDNNGDDPDDPLAGIAGISADANGIYHVYNMQGINILETKDASTLRNLKGYFIVNGKKVVIR